MQPDDLAVDAVLFHQLACSCFLQLAHGATQYLAPVALICSAFALPPTSVRYGLISSIETVPPPPPQQMLSRRLRSHLHVVAANCPEQLARLLHDPATAGEITRVVVGHPFGDGVGLKLEPAFLPCLMGVLDAI